MSLSSHKTAFFKKRIHSLMGLWLVLFLCEHLFVNSQAGLLMGDKAQGFVHAVNQIHNLPFLPFIEVFLLGVPLLFHAFFGIKYALSSKINTPSFKDQGDKPVISSWQNWGYTLQRISSWILLIGILFHVAEMRFIDYPHKVEQETSSSLFLVKLEMDRGLYALSSKLDYTLYNQEKIEVMQKSIQERENEQEFSSIAKELPKSEPYKEENALLYKTSLEYQDALLLSSALTQFMPLSNKEVVACSSSFGTASLLQVREAFKSIPVCLFYSLFVLAAIFHAGNGFWTFLCTWGVVISFIAQKRARFISLLLIAILLFFAMSSIWGSYWMYKMQ